MERGLYDHESKHIKRLMNEIVKSATNDGATRVAGWYTYTEAKHIDLVFSPLGYNVTYKGNRKESEEYWLVVSW